MSGELLGVIGPLWSPSSPSGVHFPTCTHQAPDSCPRCDGQAEDEWEQIKADREAERARAKRMTDPAYRAAWLASLPASAWARRARIQGHPTCAEEAS